MNELDYSEIQQPITVNPQSEWEPPRHVFFGKKLPNGKTEKEPTYQFQEFPRYVYFKKDEKITVRIANNEAEKQTALAQGAALSVSEFGMITAPSFEQILEMKQKKEEESVESEEFSFGSGKTEQATEQFAKVYKKRGPKPKAQV